MPAPNPYGFVLMSALLLALALPGKGQLLDERPRKDLQCTHAEVLKQVDLLVSTRSFGEYRTMAMWSQQLSSDQIMRRRYPMEGGYLYVAIVSAPQGIDALALEIRNSYGEKIEYVTKITELDNYLINHFFTPPDDDIYQFNVRVINRNSNRSCVCLVLMKGEEDPDP